MQYFKIYTLLFLFHKSKTEGDISSRETCEETEFTADSFNLCGVPSQFVNLKSF